MKEKQATSQDVARAAGVSQSTVSMILNSKKLPSFTDETIRKVYDAAHSLGYKGVRSKRSDTAVADTIAVFCPVVSNPYYAGVIQSLEQAAYESGFRTVICTTYRSADIEMRHLREINKESTAGIVFTCIPLHKEVVEDINYQIPIVVIGDRDESINVDTVEVNSYRSGVAVADHLIDLGHRNISLISTSLDNQNIIRVKRMEGIRDTMAKLGGESGFYVKSRKVSSLTDISDLDIEHRVGFELTQECLAETPFVTAIVGINDMVAYGILDALHSAGHVVPDEYSVCGFDNIFPSQMLNVSLSSVENFVQQKGRSALDILLKRITSRRGQPGMTDSITHVEYQPRLIVRASTGIACGNYTHC